MSYCNNEWISDFTYKGIRDRLFAEEGLQAEAAAEAPALRPADRVPDGSRAGPTW